jgi:hypothetical protein
MNHDSLQGTRSLIVHAFSTPDAQHASSKIAESGQLAPFTPFKSHLTNLLRNKAHHENDHGCGKKKGAHIRETSRSHIRVKVIAKSSEEEKTTHRQKDA